MDYLIIGILFFIGNIVWSVILLCFQSYAKKKGEDLATKEEIAGITKEIESVKDSYNKSLEEHKIELQKEFDDLSNTITNHTIVGQGRIIKAFPKMKHRDYYELIQELKNRF